MPLIVRWYLKTSLVYLVAALLVGIAGSFQGLAPIPAGLGPVFIHLLVVGWITQLIFGVALWMFPKKTNERPRGNERLAWAGYGLLNAGLILRAVGEPLAAAKPGSWAGWLLVASAVIQWLAGVAFAVNTWGRVKLK
jgi:hypothetical protein